MIRLFVEKLQRTLRWFRTGSVVILIVATIAGSAPSSWAAPEAPVQLSFETSLTGGALVRAADSPQVYLIENNTKRWVSSEDAFRTHGFTWDAVIVVLPDVLARYPEGEPITPESYIVLPGEEAILPDLAPFAPSALRLATVNGRTVLRFTSTFWNMGKGRFELVGGAETDIAGDQNQNTFERIFYSNGDHRDKIVGDFLWHDVHQHFHYDDFADYVLELIKPADGVPTTPPTITQKTTFCLRDNEPVNVNMPGAPRGGAYLSCGKYRQGVSVGWADVYDYTLADQYLDVHDTPPGEYRLSFVIDPRRHFVEGRQDNNTATVLVDLNVPAGTLRVLASGSPFLTNKNQFPDGLLVKAEGDSRVYVIHRNRKRWLHTEAVFRSYGYSWSDVVELPAMVVRAIPWDQLIRLAGTPGIYILNDHGYRRRILDPAVFSSYGWSSADVADINAEEFAGYPNTELIMRSGDNRVYSTATKRFVGTFDALEELGHIPTSTHVVNETDFNSYQVKIITRDLNIPWDIVFLPDGDFLVTERSGTVRRIGAYPATISLPSVLHTGEGGLMGMALHPNFAQNRLVYLYFTVAGDEETNRVVRFRLEGDRLIEDRIIIEGIPAAIRHDGGQVAFGPDGMLYITTGDASHPDLAQDLTSLAGKTLRLTPDGAIPSDNPFGTAVWSYGHRNVQGIAWDDRGRMWQTEHGSSAYDELNLVEKGKNYGWPVIRGDETRAGMVRPVLHSGTDTWAPSGLAFADGKLFFAGLRGSTLYEATPGDGNTIAKLRAHFAGVYGRLRAAVVDLDGFLNVSTSNRDGRGTVQTGDDKILRIYTEFLRE